MLASVLIVSAPGLFHASRGRSSPSCLIVPSSTSKKRVAGGPPTEQGSRVLAIPEGKKDILGRFSRHGSPSTPWKPQRAANGNNNPCGLFLHGARFVSFLHTGFRREGTYPTTLRTCNQMTVCIRATRLNAVSARFFPQREVLHRLLVAYLDRLALG